MIERGRGKRFGDGKIKRGRLAQVARCDGGSAGDSDRQDGKGESDRGK